MAAGTCPGRMLATVTVTVKTVAARQHHNPLRGHSDVSCLGCWAPGGFPEPSREWCDDFSLEQRIVQEVSSSRVFVRGSSESRRKGESLQAKAPSGVREHTAERSACTEAIPVASVWAIMQSSSPRYSKIFRAATSLLMTSMALPLRLRLKTSMPKSRLKRVAPSIR